MGTSREFGAIFGMLHLSLTHTHMHGSDVIVLLLLFSDFIGSS